VGDWYNDKKQATYVGTYADQKQMQKEIKESGQHGWIVKETDVTVGRSKPRLGGFLGSKYQNDAVTVTFVRAGSDPAAAAQSLTQYAALRDQGVLSEKEFNELKKKLLGT